MKLKLKFVVYTFVYNDRSYSVEFHPVKKDDKTTYTALIQAIQGWKQFEGIDRPNAGSAHKCLRQYLKEKGL